MPLHIFTSNRMEQLITALADQVKSPLQSPFTPEVIVVQSKGMQRWLAMELSKQFGIWANCRYPFPNSLVWQVFGSVMPESAEASLFYPEVMVWKIMDILPGFLNHEEFAPLMHYLVDDRNGLKLFQLAGKIADTFDQYTMFRPDMLSGWESGREGHWQALLWRKLSSSGKRLHRGQLKEKFCRQMAVGSPPGCNLPIRISVFGISYLPSFHLEIFAALARVTEVNLFLLSPTREYWADIVSEKEKARLSSAERAVRLEGNPLLASLGTMGRDFSNMVVDIGEMAISQTDYYEDPGKDSLLSSLQSDILSLCGAEEYQNKFLIGAHDQSVQIHSCHNPLREIEILHDNLLALLERDLDLAPRDILVMTPDIETYTPFISTVFEEGQDAARKIPYSIADRSLTGEGQVASVFLKIIDLATSKFTAPQVLDILEASPVSKRFSLTDNELEIIRRWVEETRIRWGMDEADRIGRGLPSYREGSWRSGLDRLLLGYAMPEDSGAMFNDLLPYDDMEGTHPRTLGIFVEFVEQIYGAVRNLPKARTLKEWTDELLVILDTFICTDDAISHELNTVVTILESLEKSGETAEFDDKVELAVIRSWLVSRLAQEQRGFGFLTGGVTFCAMLPMRSIPFKVIALVGMNDGTFPRQGRSPAFDLIAAKPRHGDRSLRDEDRYLFLESILSARDCLYISYMGQSIKDNSELPPSVLVSELLDTISRRFVAMEEVTVEQRLVTKHRLQAFSRDYFTAGTDLFSYSMENCSAIREKNQESWQPATFISTPLATPDVKGHDIPLEKLLIFFGNPCRFFLKHRLGIQLETEDTLLEERESFAIGGLEAYGLKQELLEVCLQEGNPKDLLTVARCRGVLPPAQHGELLFTDIANEVSDFANTLLGRCAESRILPSLEVDLTLGEFRVSGRLDGIRSDRMLRYRCAKTKTKDLVRAWLEHLVLNALNQECYPRQSTVVMIDSEHIFSQVTDAEAILQTMLELYQVGLTTPLRFFPKSAMEYGKKQEWKLDRARTAWLGNDYVKGECEDASFKLCFGNTDPFTAEFERIARTILEPLLQHQHEEMQ